MLTIAEAHRRIELFLTGQTLEALRPVEYELPSFDTEPVDVELADVARWRVEVRHVRGASDATLPGQRVRRRAADAVAAQCTQAGRRLSGAGARHARCQHLGGAARAVAHRRRECRLEIWLGPALSRNLLLRLCRQRFLENEPQQLYWRTDIVQMTRYYMIEAAGGGICLSPRRAGFPV
jgi:hypothetical protein